MNAHFRAVIVTPTLNLERAAANIERAKKLAGIPCASVLIQDIERRGEIIPINIGWKAALDLGPEYIVGLDDDAKAMTEGWLARMIEALQTHESFGMAHAKGGCLGGPQMRQWDAWPVVVAQPLASFCMVAKRQVFLDIGLYDEALIHYGGESDWEMRAMARGWKVILVPDVFFEHSAGQVDGEWWAHDRPIYEARWAR